MKKLMEIAAAALCGTVMADSVESSNVVYTTGNTAERSAPRRWQSSRRNGRASSGRRTIRKWRTRPIPKARRSGS